MKYHFHFLFILLCLPLAGQNCVDITYLQTSGIQNKLFVEYAFTSDYSTSSFEIVKILNNQKEFKQTNTEKMNNSTIVHKTQIYTIVENNEKSIVYKDFLNRKVLGFQETPG
ncbi:MAG: hypothetical protein Q4G27_05885 [Flavobacteriaceae bacterium]|nr:hypothetical protein [Flavobacteriaceae bacterium]